MNTWRFKQPIENIGMAMPSKAASPTPFSGFRSKGPIFARPIAALRGVVTAGLLLLGAIPVAEAVMVVDWSGAYVTESKAMTLPAQVVNGNSITWPYSWSNSLVPSAGYSVPSGKSGAFYGGLQVTATAAGLGAFVEPLPSSQARMYFTSSNPGAGNSTNIRGLVAFDKAGFLDGESDSETVAFEADSSMYLFVDYVLGDPVTSRIRMAVLNEGVWYLSSTYRAGSASLQVNPFSELWAEWSPSSVPFAPNPDPSAYTVAGSTFTDIQGIGYYFDISNTGNRARVGVDSIRFDALVIPEPGAGVLMGVVLAVGLLLRSKNTISSLIGKH